MRLSKLRFAHKVWHSELSFSRVHPSLCKLSHESAQPNIILARPEGVLCFYGSTTLAEASGSHDFDHFVNGVRRPSRCLGRVHIEGVHLDAAEVRVFAVLVVLEDLHLKHIRDKCVAVGSTACSLERYLLPTYRAVESEVCKLDQVVLARTGLEDDAGWGIGLVLREVDVEAQIANAHSLDKVDRKLVRLRSIRPKQSVG